MTDILRSIRDIAFLVAIYLYFAGWVYRWYYLDYFGISLGQAEAEFYFFFVYAFNVLIFAAGAWMTWLLAAGLLVALGLENARLKRLKREGGKKKESGQPKEGAVVVSRYKLIWVVLLIILFPYIFSVSKSGAWRNARREAAPMTSDLRTVQIQFTDEFVSQAALADTGARSPGNTLRDLLLFNRTGQLRLLLADKEDVFLVYQASNAVSAVPLVFDLHKSDIKWMAVQGN